MSDSSKLTRAEQKALRPIQILDAAFEEFVANGFTATRVEDIADRIGVTKGTIYVYFPTKEELFSAMIGHISMPLEKVLRETGELKGNGTERLKTLLLLFYDNISRDRNTRELLRFVISEGARFPHIIEAHRNELIDPMMENTQCVLDEGIATGEFRNAPAANARSVIGPIIALMVETLVFGQRSDLELSDQIEAHLDLVMNGLVIA